MPESRSFADQGFRVPSVISDLTVIPLEVRRAEEFLRYQNWGVTTVADYLLIVLLL